jgi:ribose transport system substrate-binding protein
MRGIRFAAVAAACAAALIAGCGDDSGGSSGGAAAEKTFQDLKAGQPSIYCGAECKQALKIDQKALDAGCTVGLSWSSTGFPYGAAAVNRSKEAVKDFPKMKLLTADGRGSATTQTSQIDDFIARGIDVLIISPFDSKALAPAVKRAEKAGIKVIASDRAVDAPVTTYIGAENVETGLNAGKYVVDLTKGQGSVIELQGSLGASPTIARHKGFMDALQGSPGVKVVASQTANYDRAQGLKVTEDLLQRYGSGKVDVVFAHNDEMALGAIQAIREAGRDNEIKVVGIDGQESALRLVKAGRYAGTVVYPLPVPEHIIAAAKVCADEQLPERIKQEAPLVTKENVAKYEGTTF